MNHKSITRLRRFQFWQNTTKKLSRLIASIEYPDYASPDDVRAFEEIHKRLYECRLFAGDCLTRIEIERLEVKNHE